MFGIEESPKWVWISLFWIAVGGWVATAAASGEVGVDDAEGGIVAEPSSFASAALPFFTDYCFGCHGVERQKADLNLAAYGNSPALFEDHKTWKTVREMLESREMPPEDKPQPTEAERLKILAFIDTELARFDCSGHRQPGKVTLRRLNRSEYNNTIRDLLGIDFEPAADFPRDEVGYGFDNIGDVLSLPPMLMEKYLNAAREIAEALLPLMSEDPDKATEIAEAAILTDFNSDIFGEFVRRAYRRPVTHEEVDRLLRFVDLAAANDGNFEEGIQLAVQAVLVSPHFLYRWELDSGRTAPGEIRPLTDHELASRLSYFLWSSMPDDELFRLADRGELTRDGNMIAQMQRMIRDPKSDAFVENFAGQWLQIRNLDAVAPDPVLFPDFDEALRAAMAKETELFFASIMREDRSVLELIDADFTFVNERLARHYGMSNVHGEAFQRVSLSADDPRGGILTQASILTITSNPTRTSPVNRGKWILEQVLGTPPPPPPANVPVLVEAGDAPLVGSLRQRTEQHRANAECAVCHNKMDPLGFAFENFDAIGRWRDRDGTFPIDPAGTLPTGEVFNGPDELKVLLKSRETFLRTMTERMLTYALGRGLEYYDQCAVDDVMAALEGNEYRFSALLTGIVESEPFLMQQN